LQTTKKKCDIFVEFLALLQYKHLIFIGHSELQPQEHMQSGLSQFIIYSPLIRGCRHKTA